ncbi:hypothetical protein AWZ03_010277 [Drosophila navojoa]|uniref:Uncharacterized protein n=1 Tax=Drosophila navojoa TaxID=7232 RepID=A0A484B657_DRONA|nr:hypothetical protein AWZ03_010277 [Drosophila navojoa]
MNKYGFYTRAVTAQLQDTPLSPFVQHREIQIRKRSSSVADNCRRYVRVDKTLEKDFARKCQRAFYMGNQAQGDISDLDAKHLLGYKESLARMSCLDLDSTLADEHRMKGWLPPIKRKM